MHLPPDTQVEPSVRLRLMMVRIPHRVRLAASLGILICCTACSSSSSSSSTTTSPKPSSTTRPVRVVDCTANQLTATVAFNATGTELGAIKLSNKTDKQCSLSGQPTVTVLGGTGVPLTLAESTYHRAPDWPPPTSPVVLSSSGTLPQAIVELDWMWCGPSPGELQFQVLFSGWPSPLVVPSSSISPAGFSPAHCSSVEAGALFAVDYVCGFGTNGIIGPS